MKADETRKENEEKCHISSIVEKALNLKKDASTLARERKYDESIEKYKQSLDVLETVETKSLINLHSFCANKFECFLNIAVCQIHLGKYSEAIDETDKVLSIHATSVKALYIRAKANKYLGKFTESLENIKEALAVKTNKCLLKELKELTEKVQVSGQKNIKYSGFDVKEQETELKCIEPHQGSNIITKLMKVIMYKLLDIVHANKSLCTVLFLISLYLLRRRFDNFTKIFNLQL